MRTFKVSDDLYEQLKNFVVDPFDDTPEAVIGRLIEIVNKAKSRWSPFDPHNAPESVQPQTQRSYTPSEEYQEEESVVVL